MVMAGENEANDVDEEIHGNDGVERHEAQEASAGDRRAIADADQAEQLDISDEAKTTRTLRTPEPPTDKDGTQRDTRSIQRLMPDLCCESRTKFSAQTSCGEQDGGYSAEIPDGLQFFRIVAESKTQPCITFVETRRGVVISFMCARKGGYEDLTKEILRHFEAYGFLNPVIIQCDKETSIIDVCRKVARERNARTMLRYAPKTSHQSNGFVEAVHGHIQGLARCYQTQIETNTGIQLSAISTAIPCAIRYTGFVLSRFTVRPDGRTPCQYLLGTPYVSPLCMFGESVFALIPDHEVCAAKLMNRWISGCWWGRDASSDEHLVGTRHGLLKCRSVRRKPPGEQWSRRETVEARGTKWNFDVEMDSGITGPPVTSRPDEEMRRRHGRKFLQYLHLHLRQKNTYLKCEVKECTRKHSGSELSGLKSAELVDAGHVRLPVWGSHTLVNARRIKMPGTTAAEQHQRRKRNVELLEIRIHDRWSGVRVQQIPTRRDQKQPL